LRKEFDKAALFVTHDLREALLLGSRIALLHEGRVEWVGPSDEFLQAPSPHAQTFLRTLERSGPMSADEFVQAEILQTSGEHVVPRRYRLCFAAVVVGAPVSHCADSACATRRWVLGVVNVDPDDPESCPVRRAGCRSR
jgi:ABC-type proline/glycine betaine transport system ATPase subunit